MELVDVKNIKGTVTVPLHRWNQVSDAYEKGWKDNKLKELHEENEELRMEIQVMKIMNSTPTWKRTLQRLRFW